MKMLMFDFRESEREFFNTHDFPDFDITFIKESLNANTELTEEQLNETDIICVFITSNVTNEIIDKFKNLRVIATRSTGYNHIDIKCCTQKNIAVFNVESYGQTSVAQFTMGLIIALVRNLFPAYLGVKNSTIVHANYEGRNLNNMTLGIIGCGAIGSAVAKLAHKIDMKVLVHSYTKPPQVSEFAEFVSLDELLINSDIVSLHLPYSPDVYHMIGKKEFEKMKDGSYIVNTARGELIDIVALYENLACGKLKGAGLDVLECEYLSLNQNNVIEDLKGINSTCFTSALVTQRLFALENVIITPHIAYNTHESVDMLLEITMNNIRDYAKGMRNNRVC